MKRGLTTRMIGASALIALLVGAVFVLLLLSIGDLRQSARLARHSEELIATSNGLEKLVLDLETGSRGFVLTRQPRFLQPWESARKEYRAAAKRLEALVADNPAQERRARALVGAIDSYYIAYSLPLVQATRRNAEAGRLTVRTGEGKRRVDGIRARFDQFTHAEARLADERRESADASGRRAVAVGIGGLAVLLLLLAAFSGYLAKVVVLPVTRVGGAARRLAGGDLSARVSVSGAGEVRELGAAFNRMAGSLGESRDELESQNAELELQTAELEDQQAQLADANDELQAQQAELEQALGQLEEEKRSVDALYGFGTLIARETDVRALAEVVLNELCTVATAEAGAVYVLDERGATTAFALAATRAIKPERLPAELEVDEGLPGRALLERRSVTADHGEGLELQAFGEQVRVGAELHVPLVQGDRVLGLVTLARLGPRPFAAGELALIEHLAGQAAVATANAISLRHALRLLTFNEALIDKTPLGIRLVDPEGNVLMDNAAMRGFIADVPAASAGRSLYDSERMKSVAASAAQSDEYRRVMEALAADPRLETSFEFENAAMRRVVEVFTTPVEDPEGNGIARLFVAREVTAEREAERLKTELVATVSHELRTPLASILGFAELMAKRDVDARTSARYAQTIHGEAQRLTGLINEFLDLQRIESEGLALSLGPFELARVLEDQLEVFSAQSAEHTLELELPSEPLQVDGDRERTAQVVANLLSNAIKYSPGGGSISVAAARKNGVVRVEVRDRGVGIPAEQQSRIFTKFFRVDSSDTREIGGTGLGLALCQEIVTAQLGRIGFDSVEGTGSTFWFELPSTESRPGVAGFALIVEDDAAAAALLAEHLEAEGVRSQVVATGEEALQRAAESPPLLVCLDVGLAGELDGWQVLARLKEAPETADVPVVVCTAGNGRPEAAALGAVDVLTKPFSGRELQSVLRRLLPRRPAYVLVVDDEPAVRELMLTTLGGDGLELAEAEDGAAALESIARRPPDAIVLDLIMPNLDGFAVLERLQADPRTRAIPVVVLTARQLGTRERQSLSAGAHALLRKSDYSGEELRRLLRTALAT